MLRTVAIFVHCFYKIQKYLRFKCLQIHNIDYSYNHNLICNCAYEELVRHFYPHVYFLNHRITICFNELFVSTNTQTRSRAVSVNLQSAVVAVR